MHPAPFVSLKKQTETLFRLIYWERKTLFQLKNKLKKTDYNEQGHTAHNLSLYKFK